MKLLKKEHIVAGGTGDTGCGYGYLMLPLQGLALSHLTAKYLRLWDQFSLAEEVTGDVAAGWQSPADGMKAAKTGENSMAKEGKEISVARINGNKQEAAQANNFEKKGLQYVSIQILQPQRVLSSNASEVFLPVF